MNPKYKGKEYVKAPTIIGKYTKDLIEILSRNLYNIYLCILYLKSL